MAYVKFDNQGFTLIELVVTLVLIGILAVVAVPKMFDADAFRSRGFFDEVVNAARYGQKLAVASGCDVELSISESGYALHQRAEGCTAGAFALDVPAPAGSGPFEATAPSGITLSPATNVVFDSLGRASGDVTITVCGRNFTIDAESGYVSGL